MSFWHKTKEETMTMVPILCKFSREGDDLWNASAEHLAVAAFGKTFEEAQKNLQEAVISHVECWVEAGKGPELVAKLLEHAKDYRSLYEMPDHEAIVKMQFGMRDDCVVAAV